MPFNDIKKLKEYQKKWRIINKEKIVKEKKRYYQKNQERLRKKQIKYHLKNKEKHAEYDKKYYQKNKEQIEIKKIKYNIKNKDKIREYKKQYRLKNKKHITKRDRKYHLKNKEKHAEWGRKYHLKNKEKHFEYNRQYRLKHPEKRLIYSIKYLKKLGYPLKLDPNAYRWAVQSWAKTVKKLGNGSCQICNLKAEVSHHILHKSKYPKLSLNVNNGIALCKNCHYEVHGWGLKS